MTDDFDESALFSAAAVQPSGNPLARYFRMPGIHVRLPSNGAYMPPNSVTFTATGDIPVYPLRAADELNLKNPDALMSGHAIEQMIASCVPAISNPGQIAMPDLDVLFLAIRSASFGPTMEVEAKCPKCDHVNAFDADLPSVLSTVKELPHNCSVRLSDEVVVMLRPYTLRSASKVSMAAFQETRRMQLIENAPEDQRSAAIAESFKKLGAINNEMTAESVIQVNTPEGPVRDRTMIREFMSNIHRDWTKKIEDAIKELNNKGMDKSLKVSCGKCEHTWETELEFDPSSFFGQGS